MRRTSEARGRGSAIPSSLAFWRGDFSPRLTHVLLLIAISLGLFTALALLVRYGYLASLDSRSLDVVRRFAPHWLYELGRFSSTLARFEWTALSVLFFAAVALALRAWRSAVGLNLMFATTLVEVAVKRFLYFPRAELLDVLRTHPRELPQQVLESLAAVESALFPSGHVARTVFLSALMIYYAARFVPWRSVRQLVQLAFVLNVAQMCVTRVVLDEHFASDVLGGILLGVAAFAPALWLHERDRLRLTSARVAAARGLSGASVCEP